MKYDGTVEQVGSRIDVFGVSPEDIRVSRLFRVRVTDRSAVSDPEFRDNVHQWLWDLLERHGQKFREIRATPEQILETLDATDGGTDGGTGGPIYSHIESWPGHPELVCLIMVTF